MLAAIKNRDCKESNQERKEKMKRTDQSSRSLAQGSRQSSKIFNLLALAVACALNVDEAFAVGTGQVKLAQVRNKSYVNSVTVSSTAA